MARYTLDGNTVCYPFPAVTVRVKSKDGAPPFRAVILDAGGAKVGKGKGKTEAGAVGAALLDARAAFEQCETCGRLVGRGELEEDDRGLALCGDCWGAL